MKAKPDINAFLDGGAGDLADKTKKNATNDAQKLVTGKVHREQKIFRLPVDLIADLKKESYERSVKIGVRVTETELVEQALKEYLYR